MKLKFLIVTSIIYFPNIDLNVFWKYKLQKFLNKNCEYYCKCNLIVTVISHGVKFTYKNTIKCYKTYLKVHDDCLHDTRWMGAKYFRVCETFCVLCVLCFKIIYYFFLDGAMPLVTAATNPYSHFIIWWRNTSRYIF